MAAWSGSPGWLAFQGGPADDSVGERNQRGQAEEAGDEDTEAAVLQHGDKAAPGQQQRGEITADDEEELHAEAVDGGVEPVKGSAGPAVHDHPGGAAQGQRDVQRDAQQHGEGAEGVEIVPAFGDQGGEFDGAGHGVWVPLN